MKRLERITLGAESLLSHRKLLTVNEAALLLNISPRKVRSYIQEGVLLRSPKLPIRVPVEEVKALLAKGRDNG